MGLHLEHAQLAPAHHVPRVVGGEYVNTREVSLSTTVVAVRLQTKDRGVEFPFIEWM